MCDLITNMARCTMCSTVIESTHRHDYVRCNCGALAVDGGTHYARRVIEPGTAYKDLSIYRPCNAEDCPDKDLEWENAEQSWVLS